MPSFGATSKANLRTVDQRIQMVLERAIQITDFSVVCGHRGERAQERAFREGKSRARFGESQHNVYPSRAVDVAPYDATTRSIPWDDVDEFHYLAGVIMAVAHDFGVPLRWGGHWENFRDMPHFELEGD